MTSWPFKIETGTSQNEGVGFTVEASLIFSYAKPQTRVETGLAALPAEDRKSY